MGNSSKGRILVVDDEADVCQLMVKLLKRLGHEAFCAYSGREALAAVQDGKKPDLILLDVMMPEMSGIEVLKRLRAGEIQTPVIIFTALSDPQLRQQAMDLGASDYWVKASLDIHEIMSRLRQYFPAGPSGPSA